MHWVAELCHHMVGCCAAVRTVESSLWQQHRAASEQQVLEDTHKVFILCVCVYMAFTIKHALDFTIKIHNQTCSLEIRVLACVEGRTVPANRKKGRLESW